MYKKVLTIQSLNSKQIYTVHDLQQKSPYYIQENFGLNGIFFYNMALGIDNREVCPPVKEKGIGNSTTLQKNISGINNIKTAISTPLKTACYRLNEQKLYTKNISIQIRYSDFTTITRTKELPTAIISLNDIYREVCYLLEQKVENYNNIRLVGVRLSSLTSEPKKQLSLFENNLYKSKLEKLNSISNTIRKNYGYDIIKDSICYEFKIVKEKQDNDYKQLDSIRNLRTIEAFKTLYR